MPLVNGNSFVDFDVLETGLFIDEITGIGGLPLGRIVEFWGKQNSGKTTAALQVIAAAQKKGLTCALVDAEYQYTSEYAEKLGVDTSALGVLRAVTAEEILDELEELIKAGKHRVIVLDSIGQLSSRIFFEKSSGEKTIGTQSSLIKQFVEKTIPYIVMNKVLFIGISHERTDMTWGKLFSLGGNKWHEKVKMSIRFKEKSYVKQGEEVVAKIITAIVTKNHCGNSEGKTMDVRLVKDGGFSVSADRLEALIAKGVFTKTGNSYYLGPEKIGTISKLRDWAKENEELMRTL